MQRASRGLSRLAVIVKCQLLLCRIILFAIAIRNYIMTSEVSVCSEDWGMGREARRLRGVDGVSSPIRPYRSGERSKLSTEV